MAGAKPAADQFNSEPKATLLVQSFGTDAKGNAIQAAKEKDLQRGSVANMTEDAEVLADQGRAIDPLQRLQIPDGHHRRRHPRWRAADPR